MFIKIIKNQIYGFREILNFFRILKIIRKGKKTKEWKELNLRTGWVGQIYTVISLRKEDMGESEAIQRILVAEKIAPINKFIEKLGIAYDIYLVIKKVPDSYSWLVVYKPLWRYFSFSTFLFRLSIVLLIYYLVLKYNLL